MGIAQAWGRERTERPAARARLTPGIPGTPAGSKVRESADQISSRVIDAIPDSAEGFRTYDLNAAAIKLADGLRQCVTFRRPVMVSAWVKSAKRRQKFDELPNVHVGAGCRGVVRMVMVDGRALVKLEGAGGHEVLAMVGKDCKHLRWWHRVIDWFKSDIE